MVDALNGVGTDLGRFRWPAEIPMHNTGEGPRGVAAGKAGLNQARASGGVQLPPRQIRFVLDNAKCGPLILQSNDWKQLKVVE
jgi:hypothetical protein